jgi:hypothetical protein
MTFLNWIKTAKVKLSRHADMIITLLAHNRADIFWGH